MPCRCNNNNNNNNSNNNKNQFSVDSNGCFDCDYVQKVKGRFGLAWIAESPDCPSPEPIGWQVEFLDTPSKVEQKCLEMVHWINCPPLPHCDPCPPGELCCLTGSKPKQALTRNTKCSCCKSQQDSAPADSASCCKKSKTKKKCSCSSSSSSRQKKCCCSSCGGCSRKRSPSTQRCSCNE